MWGNGASNCVLFIVFLNVIWLMLLSVHMLFAGDHQIVVQNRGEKQGVLLSLYLAANESDQTSCGHVLMQQVRHVMHGLPSEVPIMYSQCNVSHNFIPASASGSQLFSTQNDLSEMQFPEHCKLYVWPGESLDLLLATGSNLLHSFTPASASASQLPSIQDGLSEMQCSWHCKLYVWTAESHLLPFAVRCTFD